MKVGDLVRPKRFKSISDYCYDYPEFGEPPIQTKIPEIDIREEKPFFKKERLRANWHGGSQSLSFPDYLDKGIVIEVVECRVRVYWNERLGTMWHSEQLLEILNEGG